MTARGNERRRIVRDEADCRRFLAALARTVERHRVVVHAYCLLSNHYHVVCETPRGNLAAALHLLNGVYAQAFNERYGREGHVFQGRYQAILLEREAHLLEVSRYVVLNPVRAGMCHSPDAWMWSSYRATVGIDPVPAYLTADWVLAQFGRSRSAAQLGYRRFVADRMDESPFARLAGRVVLGREDFVDRYALDDRIDGLEEIPRAQREHARPPITSLLAEYGERGLVIAYRDHSYALKELAEALGCHYSTVSRRMRYLEEGREPPPRRRRRPRAPNAPMQDLTPGE